MYIFYRTLPFELEILSNITNCCTYSNGVHSHLLERTRYICIYNVGAKGRGTFLKLRLDFCIGAKHFFVEIGVYRFVRRVPFKRLYFKCLQISFIAEKKVCQKKIRGSRWLVESLRTNDLRTKEHEPTVCQSRSKHTKPVIKKKLKQRHKYE